MTTGNEQYKNKESFYHLEICCRFVGEKFGNPVIASWTNGDYLRLSSLLSRRTEVQISPSTLKRIFGKLKTSERYYPQKATRDALALFAGFTDWETFVEQHPKPPKKETKEFIEQINEPVASIPPPAIARKKRDWTALVFVVAALAIFVIWQMAVTENPRPVSTKGIHFICNNPGGETPHSAIFNISLPSDFTGDTSRFAVDFGDKRKDIPVLPGALFTHYYEVPGRYYAVLKYDDSPIDTISIYLQTNGWTATADMQHDSTRVYPVNTPQLFKKGKLQVTIDELFHAGIDTNRTFFVNFVNTRPLHINGDNFELTADVTTSQLRPGVRCSQVQVELYGEKSKYDIFLIKPGCVSWAHLRFSEILKDGHKEDLSPIGTDLSQGGTIKLQVVNKKVNLLVNNKATYSIAYNYPLKTLYGVKVAFAGIGSVNNLIVRDLATGAVFQEGF